MKANNKHGFAQRKNQHYLYKVWCWMKSRCYNQNDTSFYNYGKRGISVCDEWKNNPKAFIEWCSENGWKSNLVIDRINNDGNYEPSNCRFVAKAESNVNQRIRKDNTSGYRGVHYRKKYNNWIARIQVNGKRIELCWEKTAKEAAMIRDKFIMQQRLPHKLSFPNIIDGGAD